MFVVAEADPADIRTAFGRGGGLSAAIELHRQRQGAGCAQTIAGLMSHPSSATFWSLIDRWRVSDEQALELISYEGKLPTTGLRPRFRLSADQVRNVATMLEVDAALAAAGINPAWLHRRSDQMPRSPLDLMRAGAIDEVLRSLTQATLEESVAQAGGSKRSPRRLAREN